MRLRTEDRYLAVKLAVSQRVSPRYAWERYVRPLVGAEIEDQRAALRWEIRGLEELGFSATALIERTYRHGVAWVIANERDGREWVETLSSITARQMNSALERLMFSDPCEPSDERM